MFRTRAPTLVHDLGSFIFVDRQPSTAAVNAAKNLIQCGVTEGKISSSYGLLGHRQADQTNCPGTKLFELIKTWPNWLANPVA